MRVILKKYPMWIGPYQIVSILKYVGVKENTRDKISEYLANKTPLSKWCEYIYAVRNKNRVNVKIHNYDAWNADSTISLIVLPLLKELKRQKHGAPFVDDVDVPEELRSTNASPKEHEWDTDENWFKRWEYVIDEMIWTFEQLQPNCDWEAQYYEGLKRDIEGYLKHNARISNGLILFGKYFRGLWD